MMEPIRLSFTCSQKEAERVQDLALVENHGGSKWATFGCMVVPIIVGIIGLVFRIGLNNWPFTLGGLTIIVLVIMLFQRFLIPNPEPVEVEIYDWGYRVKSRNAISEVNGSGLLKLIEDGDLFVLRDSEMLFPLPKRAFDSERTMQQFRELAERWQMSDPESSDGDDVVFDDDVKNAVTAVEIRLRFRDCVARWFGSWRPRVMMIVLAVIMFSAYVVTVNNPPPDAKVSALSTLGFMVAMFPFFCLVIFIASCIFPWFTERRKNSTLRVVFFSEGYRYGLTSSSDSSGVNWSEQARFKEIFGSILLWQAGTPLWIQLPKRAFRSQQEVDELLVLLDRRARRSTWFWS